jgi:hypothetical protein
LKKIFRLGFLVKKVEYTSIVIERAGALFPAAAVFYAEWAASATFFALETKVFIARRLRE